MTAKHKASLAERWQTRTMNRRAITLARIANGTYGLSDDFEASKVDSPRHRIETRTQMKLGAAALPTEASTDIRIA